MVIPGGYLSKIPLRSGRAVVLAAPAFHAWGLLSSMISLGLGNTLVMTRKFDPKFTIAALEHFKAQGVRAVFYRRRQTRRFPSRMVRCGSAEIRACRTPT